MHSMSTPVTQQAPLVVLKAPAACCRQRVICCPNVGACHTTSGLLGRIEAPALQACVCPLQIEGELLHISLAMLVAALFFLLFVWDAIVYENAFELMASSMLAVVVAVRVLYFVVSAAATRGVPLMLLPVCVASSMLAALRQCPTGRASESRAH